MRILYNGQDFELPKGFSASLKRYNVLISEIGEQTAAFTLQGTPHNLQLTGWSNRLDSPYKPLEDITVTLIDGPEIKTCRMSFNGIPNSKTGINCTLYFTTGELYSRIADTMLTALPWPIEKSPNYNTNTLAQNVSYLISHLKTAYTTPGVDKNFKIAPIATASDVIRRVDGVDKTEKFLLNGYEKNYNTIQVLAGNDYLDVFEAEYQQTFIIDSAVVSTSTGYGMTPLLKLRYVLDFLFSHFGYTLDMSELEDLIRIDVDNTNYENIVLGNTVADAIYAGVLLYKQLVPNLKIKDFIAKLEKNLSGKFAVSESERVVKFFLYRNGLVAESDLNMDEFASGEIIPEKPEFKIIRLVNTNTENDTINDSEKQYEDINLDVVSTTTLSFAFKADTTPPTVDIGLAMGVVGETVHLNSAVKIIGKESTNTDTKISEKLHLFYALDEWQEQSVYIPNGGYHVVFYKNTDSLFYGDLNDYGENTLQKINWLYNEYIEFRQNSNIQFSIDMVIPEPILRKLNINTPKIIHGQKALIESIEYGIGQIRDTTQTQTVTFRTLRSYQDRP